MFEEWRPIPGFAPYEVSNLGRARRGGRILKPRLYQGYYKIHASCGDRKSNLGVHRAVCLAFHGEPAAGMVAAHNDGNSQNNLCGNLRWATPAENSADRIRHGTAPKGEANGKAKLSSADVKEIRRSLEPRRVLADRFNVSQTHISRIRTGQSWSDVSTLREESQRAA